MEPGGVTGWRIENMAFSAMFDIVHAMNCRGPLLQQQQQRPKKENWKTLKKVCYTVNTTQSLQKMGTSDLISWIDSRYSAPLFAALPASLH
mmetsp:Transcript_46499/g.76231  ORF Transcript_46499/g.76231 Transcript_46499/m.76231 type:complete len:91 (+) Transcript_46499:176-448(+)